MFYDQSPSGALAKFVGYLPVSKFWSSKEQIVEWNEKINGTIKNDVPVTKDISYVVNEKKFVAKKLKHMEAS